VSEAIVYGLDNCDTCRKARNWLDRHKAAYRFVDYRAERIAPETLRAFAQQLGGFDAMINRSSRTWRELPEARRAPGSDAEWTLLLREHPALLRRPVVALPDGGVSQGFSDAQFRRLFPG
jgi:Spx/MgsR family transcriptional regulator